MTVTDQEFATLSRRVSALEKSDVANTKSIEFIASTLGGMKAVQDMHTKRLDGIDGVLDGLKAVQENHTSRLGRMEADIKGLRADMPSIVADAMREVLREKKS